MAAKSNFSRLLFYGKKGEISNMRYPAFTREDNVILSVVSEQPFLFP